MKHSTKPHCAEVILSELMAASFPLTQEYLDARCVRESGTLTGAIRYALSSLMNAGLVSPGFFNGTAWSMTDEGRALLRTRPPYDCYRAIRDELRASGPMTFSDLRHACRRQASDYSPEQFTNALYALVRAGDVIDATEEGDDESSYEWME